MLVEANMLRLMTLILKKKIKKKSHTCVCVFAVCRGFGSVAQACVCCGTACGWIDTVTSARRYLSQRAGLVWSRRRDSAPVISR